jgi:hypothetical protein
MLNTMVFHLCYRYILIFLVKYSKETMSFLTIFLGEQNKKYPNHPTTISNTGLGNLKEFYGVW